MIDHFAILGQPRRLWLDADAVKDAFHRLSASLHPDVPGTGDVAKFAALNSAYSVLREPASRLRHLLELSVPAALAAASPPPLDLADLFMEIAGLRRRLDELLSKRNAATSPIVRALLAGEESALRRDLTNTQTQLSAVETNALAELRTLDASWSAAHSDATAVAHLYHRFSYLARWMTQVREALFTLG